MIRLSLGFRPLLAACFSLPVTCALLAFAVTLTVAASSSASESPASVVSPGASLLENSQEKESRKERRERKKEQDADKTEKKLEPWDVEAPVGAELFEVAIDTDEGTWLSLDVSPDGRHIVFDLLGDLYRLDIEGGDAVPLTDGLAWDMQPRFSPDGSRIAFTSDRAGGDNLFTLPFPNPEKVEPKQVSRETYRLVNNPAFSPDGQYLAARKHFTSTRSLGAGEIWLYHRAGGTGLQLNQRFNDEKDMGEPAFSPDGRYVYFSRDSTPGGRFEYSKDSNGQIYTIGRIDRQTGEIETVISGPGGAVRPTPSPDGKSIAFVRRERAQSKLFVHDLESGENRLLFDGLDRDMQEIWAIHGVYPNFAWTPGNDAIVIWAQGKFWRVAVSDGSISEIPFRVRGNRTLTRPLRFQYDPAPDRFTTKMLRWAQISPTGRHAVFESLGAIWVRDLEAGTTRRLTEASDSSDSVVFETYPSFSHDGRTIVYATWNDRDLGTVRSISIDGSNPRTLTDKPGHYIAPALAPDGTSVVYVRARGGFVTSPLWSAEPGIYWQPLDSSGRRSGDAHRIHRSGRSPHFADRSDRVFFTEVLKWNERRLSSIALERIGDNAKEPRVHATSTVATEFRVSTDGQYLAFAERFQVFLAPILDAAKPIDLGPKTDSIPVQRVSADAGEGLHWSADGQTVYWALGSSVFQRRLDETFGFLAAEGSDADLPDPPTEGLDLGFEVAADRPAGTIAFVGGRIITMAGTDDQEVISDGTVIVRENRIIAVGSRGQIPVPEDAHVVELSGRTLMPGLIDVHWHGGLGSNEIVPQQNWQLNATLAFGVTTAHNPSTDTSTFFAAAEMARAGKITAPRLFSTGTILYGASGEFKAEIETLDDARAHLRRLKAAGAFSVKSYNQPRRDQRQKIVSAARELEMLVVNEGGALFQHNMTMVADGHTGIEHSLSVGAIYDDVRQFWGATEVGNTPTLVVAFGGIEGERYWYQHTNVWENQRLTTFVPRARIDSRSRRRVMAPDEDYNHFRAAKVVKELSDAGVSIQLGAHGQREGLGAHWELWMFEQGGMSAHQALRSGTIQGARYLGLERHLGSVEEGKLADLIVIDGNPLDDLRSSEQVDLVMVNGRLFDAATMNEVGNHPRQRPPLAWVEE